MPKSEESLLSKVAKARGGIAPSPSENGKHAPKGLLTTALDTIDPEPVHWLVPGYIPLGKLVMFAGDGGHGKSTLTLHLAACLTTGRPCFSRVYEPPDPCEVLMISCEDDYADTVVPRLLAAGADLSKIRRVDGIPTTDGRCASFSCAHYERLEDELAERKGVRLVVIDPAGAYIGRSGVDDHKDSELRTLLDPMAELAGRKRCTIIIVKHLNKGASAKAVHKVSGSAGYVNACRVSFVIAPQPSDENRKLFIPLKFNITKKPTGLAFEMKSLDELEREEILNRFPKIEGDDRTRLGEQLYRPEWVGDAGMDADTALGDADQQKPNVAKDCADWLVGFLGEYAWPDQEVQDAASDAGYGIGALKRAKARLRDERRLGSKAMGMGGAWWNWIGTDRPSNRPKPYQSRQSVQSRQSELPPEEVATLPFDQSEHPIPD